VTSGQPILSIKNAAMAFGDQSLWQNLDLDVAPGEFIAIIGASGSGKTVLLKTILGQEKLSKGTIKLFGKTIGRGSRLIGYIPQHRQADAGQPIRAKDLLRFGLEGHRFGIPIPSLKTKNLVTEMLTAVNASDLAEQPIGELSGGQLQRIRVAQAVIDKPKIILADEPLSALDLTQQAVVADLLNRQRLENKSAVLFVTHDVNPILNYIDRILYLANGQFRIGTPDEVLRSEVLSELYGSQVDVLRSQGRIVVVGTSDHDHHDQEKWV
jgi:zinc/manganese transport system ATP-binding protein